VTRVEPAGALRGAVAVPGDKSISHRGLLLGAVAEGETVVRGLLRAGDTESTIDALRALGVAIEDAGDAVTVRGAGLRGLAEPADPVDCGNAGTLVRLVAGLLAGQAGRRFELTGDESLRSRPMERVAEPLRRLGAGVETTAGRLPLRIEGRSLEGIEYALPVASAQVKSCVLLAGLYASGRTTVLEPLPTRDHTERMLRAAGARVEARPGRITVWPAERLSPLSIDVPGDFSAAAPLIAAATIVPGSELVLAGVGVNPTRTGFLHVLERMGARIQLFNRRTVGGEPVADIDVRHAELTATGIAPGEVPLLVDELPLFALVSAVAHGDSEVRGAQELRAKETDRIETVTTGLRRLGVHIAPRDDGFAVRGVPSRPRGGSMTSGGDHRIAMLGAVAGLASREGVQIEDAEAVAISFPGFFELLEGISVR